MSDIMKTKKELEIENCELRQEIRGLKKTLKQVAPLFRIDRYYGAYDVTVQVRGKTGKYEPFLTMVVSNTGFNEEDEVHDVYVEVLDVFKRHGYD